MKLWARHISATTALAIAFLTAPFIIMLVPNNPERPTRCAALFHLPLNHDTGFVSSGGEGGHS